MKTKNSKMYKLFVPEKDITQTQKVEDISKEISFLEYLKKQLESQREQHKEVIKAFRLKKPENKYEVFELISLCQATNGCNEKLLRENFPLIEWGKFKSIYRSDKIYQENLNQIIKNIAVLKMLQSKMYDLIFTDQDWRQMKHKHYYKYFKGNLSEIN